MILMISDGLTGRRGRPHQLARQVTTPRAADLTASRPYRHRLAGSPARLAAPPSLPRGVTHTTWRVRPHRLTRLPSQGRRGTHTRLQRGHIRPQFRSHRVAGGVSPHRVSSLTSSRDRSHRLACSPTHGSQEGHTRSEDHPHPHLRSVSPGLRLGHTRSRVRPHRVARSVSPSGAISEAITVPLRCLGLARPTAPEAVLARGRSLSRARLPSQQSAESDKLETRAPNRAVAQDNDVGLRLGHLASVGERVEMSGQRSANAQLGCSSRIGGSIDAGQSGHPGRECAVGFPFDDDRVVLRHSPASFKMRAARPVPTSFFV